MLQSDQTLIGEKICAKIALLDYLMPHLNGLDLYRRIRELDARMRVLILTATHEHLTNIGNSQENESLPTKPCNGVNMAILFLLMVTWSHSINGTPLIQNEN